MRHWNNARGTGNLFSIDLMDATGTQIQGTFFKEFADSQYDKIQENKVYLFSNGTIKMANQKFTSIKNDHAITFDIGSLIEEVTEDTRIATQGFSFTKIKAIETLMPGNSIDVLGVVLSITQVTSINTRNGE